MAIKAKEKKKRFTPGAPQARTAAQREAQRAARGKGAAQRTRKSKTATPAQARARETVQETAAPEQAAQRGGFRGGGAGRTQEGALTRMQRQVTAQRRTRGALSGPGAGRDVPPGQAPGPLWEAAKGMHLGFLGPEETWAERLLAGDRAGASANLRGVVYGAAGLGGRDPSGPAGPAPLIGGPGTRAAETGGQWLLDVAADALHDFGDRQETYGEKLGRGDVGGAALNFIGTGLRAPQNLFLNALSAAQDVAAGESPEYRYDMGGMEYLQRAEERSGKPGAYTWLQEQRGSENPLRQFMGNAAALGYELGTDPLSYLDAGGVWRGVQGRTPGTPTYNAGVRSGRSAEDLARQAGGDSRAAWPDEEPDSIEFSIENGIIGTEDGTTALSPIFMSHTDQTFLNMKNVKPIFGYEDVAIHGSPYFAYGYGIDDLGEIKYTAQNLADMLRESGTWHGGDIRLLSCEAGARPDGLAQQLADILGVRVIAPDQTLYSVPGFGGETRLYIGSEAGVANGKWITFEPRR